MPAFCGRHKCIHLSNKSPCCGSLTKLRRGKDFFAEDSDEVEELLFLAGLGDTEGYMRDSTNWRFPSLQTIRSYSKFMDTVEPCLVER